MSEPLKDVSNYNEVVVSFDALGLKEELLRGILGYGLDAPSWIQKRAILPVINGHDVFVQAKSGTDSTAAFSISTLQNININVKKTQALIVAPTRNLTNQIQKVVAALGSFLKVQCHVCVGDTKNFQDDIAVLKDGVHIVIGTPDQVNNLIRQGYLQPDSIKMFVLDETDAILSLWGSTRIYDISKRLPTGTQIVLLFASMTQEVLGVTTKLLREPVKIVKKDELTLEGVRHFYVDCEQEEFKIVKLMDLLTTIDITHSLIFCNTRRQVEYLQEELTKEFVVSAMHGDMNQAQRNTILEEFRKGYSRILISTDVIARGNYVQELSLVINYDLPTNLQSYLYRIGRRGPSSRKGVVINFVTPKESGSIKEIENFYATQIKEMPGSLDELI